MARKKKNFFSFFGDEGDNSVYDKKPIDDCEGVPNGKVGDSTACAKVAPREDDLDKALLENKTLKLEVEALEKALAQVQNEREQYKKESSDLRYQLLQFKLRESDEKLYRTSGLPARRVRRIASKSVIFKGKTRKQV